MTNWKQLAENRFSETDRENETISFGDPATEEQLEEVEAALNITLPIQLRELLGQFNGVQSSMGDWHILDTDQLIAINQENREFYGDWDICLFRSTTPSYFATTTVRATIVQSA